MAKLSARGRTEVARFESSTPDHGTAKRSYVLMSDSTVLWKATWRSEATEYSKARTVSSGWRKHGKLKSGVDPQDWIDAMAKKGFVRIYGGVR